MNFLKNLENLGAKTFFFGDNFRFVSLVLGLEHFCPWSREVCSRIGLFCVLGLEPCVLDSTSVFMNCSISYTSYHTRHSEVFNIIHFLRLRKSSGHDNIDSYFIRIACDERALNQSYLFHLSFEFGIFSGCLKTSKIIPIFKAGPKTEINNHRPISLLSSFSKILKKLIYTRLSKFLEKNKTIFTLTNMVFDKTYLLHMLCWI